MVHRRSQRSADLHTQGPVSLRIGIRGKADASIWRIAAATAGQPKRGCAAVQPLDSDDARCVIAGVRRDEEIAPQESAQAIVEEPRLELPHPSFERESSIKRRTQIRPGCTI